MLEQSSDELENTIRDLEEKNNSVEDEGRQLTELCLQYKNRTTNLLSLIFQRVPYFVEANFQITMAQFVLLNFEELEND